MEDKKETFTYTYSASQQEEVRRIREKYVPREEDKMERLRRLDRAATRPGTVAALIVGIAGTLTMGLGMCCTIEWSEALFFPGIVIGVVGIIGICAAYPLYLQITKRQRDRLAPEILRLTEELIQ